VTPWPRLAGVLAAATVALLALAPPALATFPGSNGEIVYVDDHVRSANRVFSLRTIQPDGTAARILLMEGHPPDTFPFDADYSPDGSQIAIVAIGGTLGHDRLLIMDAETGQWDVILRISRLSQDSFIASVAFSPTGDRLLFCAVDLGGPNRARLLTIGVDGSNVVLVSDRPSCVADWSSTDQIVALGGHDLRRIVTMDPDGSNRETVVPALDDPSAAALGINPTWSPDGSVFTYAFPVGASEQYEVFTAASDGSGRNRLTHTPRRDDVFPIFSPDGTAIAFTRGKDPDGGDLFTMAPSGANVQRLTDSPWTSESTRSWQSLP
jgi:Tol biopolymer transport system component